MIGKTNARSGGGSGGSSDPLITLSGSLVRFASSASKPFVSTEVSIAPQQDLHGQDAPYPAGGGTNLLNFPNPVTATGEGKPIDAQALDKAIPAGEYTVGITSSAAIAWQVIFKDASNNNVGTFSSPGRTVGRQTKTATLSATASKITIYVNGATTLTNIMMNTGSTALAYAPYSNICPISGWDAVKVWVQPTHNTSANPTTTIQLGDTVYGGTLTINEDGSGELAAEWAKYVMDGSTNAFNVMSDSGTYKFVSKTNYTVPGYNTSTSNDPPTLYCNMFKAKGISSLGNAFISGKYFRVCIDPSFADVAAFNTYLTEHNLEYVYKLETPITIPLTASQINTLIGENNVWADSGDIEVTVYGTEQSLNNL